MGYHSAANREDVYKRQEQHIAHRVHVHGPAHAEIQHQAVFKANQRAGEIVHGEFAAALYGIVVLGVLSEVIGGIGGNLSLIHIWPDSPRFLRLTAS